MANYLLEIGMEEIPARFLVSIQHQLKDLLANFLQENRLNYQTMGTFATPRRIAVIVSDLANRQEDVETLAKGPSLKIAQDPQGQWTKAALGFMKGQGANEEDLLIDDVKGESYIFVHKFIKGRPSDEILRNLPEALSKFNFPVAMRWNEMEQSFIRPIHWIVSLLDDEVVPFNFFGIQAGDISQGHRFLGKEIQIQHVDDYVQTLKSEKVMVDFAQRQAMIRQQIHDIAKQKGWNVPIDEDLLEEVTAIVEWPTAFYGEFDCKYLDIPSIISITAMKDHQRYFYVLDKDQDHLLPFFISVRNGDEYALDNVIKGNLKVLTARLEDALFFYQEDLKQPLSTYVQKLETVKEHFKLGNLQEKQERVGKMVTLLPSVYTEIPQKDIDIAKAAADIYKFDLMTNTVGEFSELQGTIGGIFAKEYGQDTAISQAIASQYLPTSSGGELPDTIAGSVLSFIDKFDTVAQYFSIDMIPTGSNDPYALRRQTMGMVEMIMTGCWDGDLINLIEIYQKTFTISNIKTPMVDFIKARVSQYLSTQGIDYDIIEAVLDVSHLNIFQMMGSANSLQAFKESNMEGYRQTMESMTRIVNLGKRQSHSGALQVTLAQTESESTMLRWASQLEVTSIDRLLKEFVDNSHLIDIYFENNMVNADQEEIRENRLSTMTRLSDSIIKYLNPQQLVIKS